MGQKVNPHGLRVGVIKNWDSRWYASDEKFGDILVSDYNLREHLKNKLLSAGISKIEIERDAKETVKVFIHCAKPVCFSTSSLILSISDPPLPIIIPGFAQWINTFTVSFASLSISIFEMPAFISLFLRCSLKL